MAIERLSLIDVITSATNFAVNVNNQDYRVLASTVAEYVSEQINQTAKTIQYSAPSATGFSVTVAEPSKSSWLVLTPAAGYAAGTIVLPPVAGVIEGQELLVNCTQSVAALTVSGNGATVIGAPTALSANDFFTLKFEPVLKYWYRVG